MNIETNISEKLWNEIRNSYKDRRFSDSIKESVYFLSDVIRDKAGLQGDGVELIGKSFGGTNPILKINKFQSKSDISQQTGLLHVLMGIYELIRNPRSHGKVEDEESTANAVLLFINYLINIIDKSKTKFTEIDYVERVFDPSFVESDRYAELLVKDIPIKKRLDIFIAIYRKKESGDGNKLQYFFKHLIEKLNKDEKKQIYEIISEELKKTRIDKTIIMVFQILPPKYWKEIDETARLRTENRIIESIEDGKYTNEGKCTGGSLATWGRDFFVKFCLIEELDSKIISKLDTDDREKQNYVFVFFKDYLDIIINKQYSWMNSIIVKKLQEGDKRFYDIIEDKSEEIKKQFKKVLEEFEEKDLEESNYTDEDIPF